MGQRADSTSITLAFRSRCFRATELGKKLIHTTELQKVHSHGLSRHRHDVLVMCTDGMWFGQLRQFMPPRSLEESLHILLRLGLVEMMDVPPLVAIHGQGSIGGPAPGGPVAGPGHTGRRLQQREP
jgi:hypothetical protein